MTDAERRSRAAAAGRRRRLPGARRRPRADRDRHLQQRATVATPTSRARRGVDELLAGIPQSEMTLGDPQASGRTDRVRRPAVPGLQGLLGRNPAADYREPGQEGRSEDRLPQLHDHRRAIGGRRSGRAGGRQAGPRLELRRALLPEPGRRGLGLRRRRIPRSRRQRRRRPEPGQMERRTRRVHRQKSKRRPQEAENLGFSGTPSFAVKGPNTKASKLLGTPRSAGELESAIEEAG